MTNDDENTARGGLGPPVSSRRAPVVRTTAPAGTPAKPAEPFIDEGGPIGGAGMRGPRMGGTPVSNAAPRTGHSDRSVNGIAPPRTVGGHTARLNVAGDIDTEPPPSSLPVLGAIAAAGSQSGTVRMLTPPELGPPPPHLAPAQSPGAPSPGALQAPAADSPHAAAPTPQPPATGAPTQPAPPAASPSGSDRPLPIAWFSPMPVAVGIISFSLGCMIGLVADMRIARGRPPPVAESAAATATATAAPAKPTATATAAPHAASAPAATTAAATVAPRTASPPAPQSPGAVRPPRPPAPPPPPPPGAAARPSPRPPSPPPPRPPPPPRKPSRPGLPFD